MAFRRFTHFDDRFDGCGEYRDTDSMTTAMRWHSQAVKSPETERSYVREYDEDGELVRSIADHWKADEVQA